MISSSETGSRFVFLDYLRALAAWLVVWDHLGNVLPRGRGQDWGPADFVREHFTAPQGIIQDFGWFGVAVFFLISGFIISDRARVESASEFVVKRVLRIYPMLAVAVALSAAFLAPKEQVTVENVLLNLTLANYVMVPQIVLVGVAWTLVIEMVFYALTAATQFARDWPHRIGLNLAFTALVIWQARGFGDQWFLFSISASYLPVLVMGQTVYWWLARGRLSAAWGLGYLAAAYGIFLWGLKTLQPDFLPITNSYLVSVTYALLLFIVMLHIRLPERRWVRLLSETSYSMYLLHGIIGWLVLSALIDRIPLTPAILVAAATSLAASLATQRLIEQPAQKLARRLTRPTPEPAPAT
jgi:peptidoglycan/LPS O-acetylase OafA/YrhL